MKTCKIFLISKDQDVIEDLQFLVSLFHGWELRIYDSREKALVDYFQDNPELSIIDLDLVDINFESEVQKRGIGDSIPLLLFLSSEAITSLNAQWAAQIGALDYIQKPVDLDKIVFAISIAQGPNGC